MGLGEPGDAAGHWPGDFRAWSGVPGLFKSGKMGAATWCVLHQLSNPVSTGKSLN